MLRPARHVADHRRVDVAIAELGADHLVALALLDVGDGGENRTALPALRRIVADVGPPHRAPLAAADRGVARRADIALADLATLVLVRYPQVRSDQAGKRRGELP